MLNAWTEGLSSLRHERVYALGDWRSNAAFKGFSEPPKLSEIEAIKKVGRSSLLGRR